MPDQKLQTPSRYAGEDTSVAVRVLLTSGGQRVVETADGAHSSGEFFIVTKGSPSGGSTEILLTLFAKDVVGAEIVTDGSVTGYVAGAGTSSK